MIIAVIYATFAVAKRKPEILFVTAKVAYITAMIIFHLISSLMTTQCSSTIAIVKKNPHICLTSGRRLFGRGVSLGRRRRLPKSQSLFPFFYCFILFVSPNLSK